MFTEGQYFLMLFVECGIFIIIIEMILLHKYGERCRAWCCPAKSREVAFRRYKERSMQQRVGRLLATKRYKYDVFWRTLRRTTSW
jgi:hypothetical protein